MYAFVQLNCFFVFPHGAWSYQLPHHWGREASQVRSSKPDSSGNKVWTVHLGLPAETTNQPGWEALAASQWKYLNF